MDDERSTVDQPAERSGRRRLGRVRPVFLASGVLTLLLVGGMYGATRPRVSTFCTVAAVAGAEELRYETPASAYAHQMARGGRSFRSASFRTGPSETVELPSDLDDFDRRGDGSETYYTWRYGDSREIRVDISDDAGGWYTTGINDCHRRTGA